ncbi:MAG: OmpA family protein [Myxococcales bacterium]|nr:OmpA family protein [Myxococcales bacterium]
MRPRLLLVLLTTGCVPVALLQANRDALRGEVADARALQRCAPAQLALAEANLAFAEVELGQGNLRRADEHLAVGRKSASLVMGCPANIEVTPSPAVADTPFDKLPEAPVEPVKKVLADGDKDGDGVKDADDICPNDPEDLDAFKDADGCPELDNDKDGVNDSADRCGMQAEDRDGFEDGDGCPDLDNDRDGLADGEDRCPDKAGATRDGGCPSQDRDRDGLADGVDQCPDVAETVNGYLDVDGCPDSKPSRVEVTGTAIVIHQRINFATGKDVILPDSFAVLDDVAQAMKDYPKIKIEIGGHTDNVGDDAKNQKLSKDRADSVFEYLLSKGVAAPRLITIGYGETRPLDTNRTEEGRGNNRRVEFLIVGANTEPVPAAPAQPQPEPSPWR